MLKGNYTIPKTGFETLREISGSVRNLLLGRPVANGEVILIANDGSFGQTKTDSAGLFSFFSHYPDSTSVFVQAKNQKGKSGVELVLKQEKFPRLIHAPVSLQLSPDVINTASQPFDFIKKAGQRAQYDEDMKYIHLTEVTVTAKRIDKKDEARLQFWGNAGSDKTIYRQEIENRHASQVTQLLYGIAGVYVGSNGAISIRGSMGPPIVLIDGIPIEWPPGGLHSIYESPLEMVSVFDVESIDIFKGPSAAIFGMRGANGAISITTRRGDSSSSSTDFRTNFAVLTPLGYQKPVEFYAPKYDTPASKNFKLPDYRTTIYWKPDIILSDDGKAAFDFYTSDFATTYSVVIEGLSNDGKIIRHVETIEVK